MTKEYASIIELFTTMTDMLQEKVLDKVDVEVSAVKDKTTGETMVKIALDDGETTFVTPPVVLEENDTPTTLLDKILAEVPERFTTSKPKWDDNDLGEDAEIYKCIDAIHCELNKIADILARRK